MNDEDLNEFNEESKKIGKRLVLLSKKMSEDQESNPPVDEINNIMFDIANMLSIEKKDKEKKEIITLCELSLVIEKKIGEVMKIVITQLTSEEYGLNAPELAAYFLEKLAVMQGYNSLGDDTMKGTMTRICRADLEIHQKTRDLYINGDDNSFIYDNEEEYNAIGHLCEITDLKGTSQRLVDEIEDAYMHNLNVYNVRRIARNDTVDIGRPR